MADQDWKTGGLNRQKYVACKPCPTCGGTGNEFGPNVFSLGCETCNGTGAVPPSDDNAKYFVLRIDCGPNGPHDPNARAALYDYANYVAEDNQQFASDIRDWLDDTLT